VSAMPTHGAPEARKHASLGASGWFIGVAGLWTAFGVVALLSTERLADLWNWVVGLPLVAEIVVWIAFFPWVLGLWVSQTSWPEWLRILLVASFAIGWTLVSIPRRRDSQTIGRVPWELRSGDPHDLEITRRGTQAVRR
jgi:hypothetical protein